MRGTSIERTIAEAKKKGLRPGRVKGSDRIELTKGKDKRLEIITWEEYEATLKRRGLRTRDSGGWTKMKKKGGWSGGSKTRRGPSSAEIRASLKFRLISPTEVDLLVLPRLAASAVVELLAESAGNGDVTLDSLLESVRGSEP